MKEVWKDIDGFEGLYQISNLGRVKSIARLEYNKNGRPLPIKERIMFGISSTGGYKRIILCKNRIKTKKWVHRLVAIHFIENPTKKNMVNHIDSNPSNNRVENLEWVTMRENVLHSLRKKSSRKKKSKYPGVHFNTINTYKVWNSTVYHNGKSIFIGNFITEEEAHLAYKMKLKELNIDNKYADV